MAIGLTFLILGIVILPAGIMYFKQTWNEYKKLTPNKKKIVVLLEMVDMLSFASLSAWLLFISLICIAFGIIVIYFNYMY